MNSKHVYPYHASTYCLPQLLSGLLAQRALRDILMSRGKNCLPTVSRQFLTRNYPRPNRLLKCLPNCLSPHRRGHFSSFKITPAVRVITRQLRGKNCTGAIFQRRKKRTQPPPKENLLENFSGLKEKLPGRWWIQKPYKNQENHIHHRNLSSVDPTFSAKKSSALEQGGVRFPFPSFCPGTSRCLARPTGCPFSLVHSSDCGDHAWISVEPCLERNLFQQQVTLRIFSGYF